MLFRMISVSIVVGLVAASSASFAMEGGGGSEDHYSKDKERQFRGDSATRTHRDGSTTTSSEAYRGGRDVTKRDGSKHKSPWNHTPWATWTDAKTGESGARAGDGRQEPRRDSATRTHRDGNTTTSRADGNGGRDVTRSDGGAEKSRWTNKAWATWTDTSTGQTGSWGAPPGR